MNGRSDLIGAVLAVDADQIRRAAERLERAPVIRTKMAEPGSLSTRTHDLARTAQHLVPVLFRERQGDEVLVPANSSSKSPGTFGDTPS
ncbi:hypothetical protein CSE45_3963 [Citreicella sp. SE45]|nr:hypothetical protein CSE45_3963 [Citreicella sp. SE45]